MTAELLATLRIFKCGIKTSLGNADRKSTDPDPPFFKDTHDHVKATVQITQQVVFRHGDTIKKEGSHVGGTLPHLVFLRAAGDTAGMKIYNKNTHSPVASVRISSCQDNADIGKWSVINP